MINGMTVQCALIRQTLQCSSSTHNTSRLFGNIYLSNTHSRCHAQQDLFASLWWWLLESFHHSRDDLLPASRRAQVSSPTIESMREATRRQEYPWNCKRQLSDCPMLERYVQTAIQLVWNIGITVSLPAYSDAPVSGNTSRQWLTYHTTFTRRNYRKHTVDTL